MQNLEKKTTGTFIYGIGNIEIDIIQRGKESWLKEIEEFVTQSADCFTIIVMQKPELKQAIHLQRALQAFVLHIQSGGEEQKSSMIRKHFRNWINQQNGSLIKIISDDGYKPTNGSNTAAKGTSTDRVEALRNW